MQIQANKFSYSGNSGIHLNTNNIYLDYKMQNLNNAKSEYYNINDFLFRYRKINGDFFSLLSIYAESEFLKQHTEINDKIDIKAKLHSNAMYIDLLKKVIYGYSNIVITDDILSRYVDIAKNLDFSNFYVDSIYKIGLEKESEISLYSAVENYNRKNKKIYGYLPNIGATLSYSNTFINETTPSINVNFDISIPNLGLSTDISASTQSGETIWDYSISIKLPRNKYTAHNVGQNEYSFSSESFLINLSNLLYSYELTKNYKDSYTEYEHFMIRINLLSNIKSYLELY